MLICLTCKQKTISYDNCTQYINSNVIQCNTFALPILLSTSVFKNLLQYFVPRKIFEPVNVLILSSWYEIFVQETAVNGQPNSASRTDGQTSIKSKQVV